MLLLLTAKEWAGRDQIDRRRRRTQSHRKQGQGIARTHSERGRATTNCSAQRHAKSLGISYPGSNSSQSHNVGAQSTIKACGVQLTRSRYRKALWWRHLGCSSFMMPLSFFCASFYVSIAKRSCELFNDRDPCSSI